MSHNRKPLIKCIRCGVLKSAKGKYCKPCNADVKEEYSHSYNRVKR